MATNRYKMKWLKGAAHYGVLDVYQPIVDYDIPGFVRIVTNYYQNWEDASANFAELSWGRYPDGFPSDVTILADQDMVGTIYDGWFPNDWPHIYSTSEITAGDRFIMSNGSYWLVTGGRVVNGGYRYITLEGHLETGEIAYSGVKWEVFTANDNATCSSMPWLIYHNPQYKIQNVNAIASGYSNACYFYNDTSQWDPVSATLGGRFWSGLTPDEPDDPDDPYPDVPDSDDDFPDQPDGIPDPDPIPLPPDPPIDVQNVGFIRLFAPTESQLTSLASYMWSSAFSLDSFKKLFADPMDCILGLNIVPVNVPRGTATNVTVGNISTGIQMYPAASQWITVNCGSVDLGQIYDTYLDYAPYTKWSLFLPYIGMVQLNTDDVAHRALQVVYKVDILSCACIAFVKAGDQVLYHFAGSCGYSVPITSVNFASLYQSIVDVGVSAAMLAVTAGAAAPAEGASAAAAKSAERAVAAQAANLATSSASAVTGSKPLVKRSGAVGAGSGIMDIQTPYLIVEVPRLCKPARQAHFVGYPSFITVQISGIGSGDGTYYAQFESVILTGLSATAEELTMLEDMLKGGIYV